MMLMLNETVQQKIYCLFLERNILIWYSWKRRLYVQTIGGDRMVGPLEKFPRHFWPISHKRGGDRTTTFRRRDVGAESGPPSSPRSNLHPGLSRIWDSPARHLWLYFHFWPLSRPWGVARLLGLRGVPPLPHPSEGVG